MRAKCKNLLHLNLKIFENENLRVLWMFITRLVMPVMEENGRFLVMQKTKQGCLQWRLEMRFGLPAFVVRESWDKLADEDLLIATRLAPFHDGCKQFLLNDVEAEQLSQACYKYWLHLSGAFYMWSMRYMSMPPASFVGLLDPGRRRAVLTELRSSWQDRQALEHAAHNDKYLRTLLDKLTWTGAPWPREVMISLDEMEFEGVPEDMDMELRHAFQTFASTKLVEDGFNCCRDRIRHNKPGRMSRMMRSFALVTSPLLQDVDRDPITIDAQAKLRGPSGLQPECFAAKGVSEFSLGGTTSWTRS